MSKLSLNNLVYDNELAWPTAIIPAPCVEAEDAKHADYLKLILDSNVYDICSETPLTHATKVLNPDTAVQTIQQQHLP
jgi:hypothetical protein